MTMKLAFFKPLSKADVDRIAASAGVCTHLTIVTSPSLACKWGAEPREEEKEEEEEEDREDRVALQRVVHLLAEMRALTHLTLCAHISAPHDQIALAHALARMPLLRHLGLNGMECGAAASAAFGDFIRSAALETLDIGIWFMSPGRGCGARAAQLLAAIAAARPHTIRRLSFEYHVPRQCDARVVDALCDLLDENTALQELWIMGCFGGKDSERLFIALSDNHTLTATNLIAHMVLFPRGACADFGTLMRDSSTLTLIHLAFLPLTGSGWNTDLIFKCIEHSSSLQTLVAWPTNTPIPSSTQHILDLNATRTNDFILK